jgi:hypothetical protein
MDDYYKIIHTTQGGSSWAGLLLLGGYIGLPDIHCFYCVGLVPPLLTMAWVVTDDDVRSSMVAYKRSVVFLRGEIQLLHAENA